MDDEERPKVSKLSALGARLTTAANINRGQRCDVYVGRGTPFGNPFAIGEKDVDGKKIDRAEAIRRYRDYFHQRLQMDPTFKAKVLTLKGKVLGCHCRPMECHSDVIIDYLDGPRADMPR